MVGITIASMMPVELNKMSRSAAAIGPFGSSTPSEQPPRAVMPIKATASASARISGPFAGQESCEQHEQIQDGKSKQAVRRPSIGLAAANQLQRERNECHSADNGGDAIYRAGKPKRPRQE